LQEERLQAALAATAAACSAASLLSGRFPRACDKKLSSKLLLLLLLLLLQIPAQKLGQLAS
jgi:hypothetical protein